jgi:hypothetical protein
MRGLGQIVTGRTKYEILQFAELNALDPHFLKLISENDEAYNSFHSLFMQLKGTIEERIHIINEAIAYVRNKHRYM